MVHDIFGVAASIQGTGVRRALDLIIPHLSMRQRAAAHARPVAEFAPEDVPHLVIPRDVRKQPAKTLEPSPESYRKLAGM